ncbi:MAG: tetratricopeptide repeat protein [Nitrospirae bacterium]|nr:tetratricopeptide repeat protein [Nitrospirota bacterium]
MFFRLFFFLVVFVALIAWIAQLNPGTVQIALPGDYVQEASKISVMLGSAVFGSLVVLLGLSVKATGEYFHNWKSSRNRQKDYKVQSLYSKGLNALLSRRFDVAAANFEKALALKPNHADSLLRLGNIYYKDGDYAEAIKLHQRARNVDEENIEVLFALAMDYEDSRRTEDALQSLEDLLEKDEGNLRALTRIRDIHQRMGEFEKAEEAQQRVLKLNMPAKDKEAEQQRLMGLRYETGRVMLEAGNLDKAKRLFKSLVKMDKDFVPAYLGLGEVHLEEGESAEAASLWEEAYKATGSIIFLHRLEDLYLKLGAPAKIINVYKTALLRNPKDSNLNFFLGKLYFRLEMVDDAFETLSSIDSSNRQFTDLHKLLANLYMRRGSCQDAISEFKKALAYSDQHIVPYRCGNCDYFSTDWSGRCPRCGKWNSYDIDLDKYC